MRCAIKSYSAGVKRILIVDDEPAICELCQRILASEQFELDIAVNGKAAQEMGAKGQYALLIIDIRLPIMDGKELYLWLKEEQPHMAGRVIFTTGSVVDMDTMSFLKQSGRPWLPKPFTPDELKAIVKETLEEVEQ